MHLQMNSGHSLNDVQIPSSNCWLIPAGSLFLLGVREEFPPGLSVSKVWRPAAEQKGTDTVLMGDGAEMRAQL